MCWLMILFIVKSRLTMTVKYEIEMFNENNFLLWKLKTETILTKDNCGNAIEERPMDITNQWWREIKTMLSQICTQQ